MAELVGYEFELIQVSVGLNLTGADQTYRLEMLTVKKKLKNSLQAFQRAVLSRAGLTPERG